MTARRILKAIVRFERVIKKIRILPAHIRDKAQKWGSDVEELGILEANEKIAYRVTYIVDPQGVIRWVCANDLSVGRNVDEVLRVLDALQTDELCPCNWKQGEETLSV